mgnify:CR=1 FL=1
MQKYKKTSKVRLEDKSTCITQIAKLAELIRDGEEEHLEHYNELVLNYAKVTNMQAPASETDPIAWDLFCELAGGDPGKIAYAGGRRGLNYLEMVKFNRGYWR